MSKPESVTRTAMDVAREMISQPALFLEFDGTDGFCPPPQQAAQRYTGERLEERTMLKVGALRLLGASDRQIEQLCHVTRRSIPAILAALEKSGRITPLKERLSQVIGSNAEHANIVLRGLLERAETESPTVELAAMIKGVGTVVGITTEKYLLTTGQATEIIETRVGAGRDEFEAWWREQVKPIELAKDCESPASVTEGPQTAATPDQRHEPDTLAAQGPPGDPGGGGAPKPPGGSNGDESIGF